MKCVKFDWCFAAKHGNHDFEFALGGVDFGNGAVEAFEWTIGDGDNFANFIFDGEFWIFNAHTLLDFGNFLFGNWGWLGASADEAGDAWGVTNDVPGFI